MSRGIVMRFVDRYFDFRVIFAILLLPRTSVLAGVLQSLRVTHLDGDDDSALVFRTAVLVGVLQTVHTTVAGDYFDSALVPPTLLCPTDSYNI